MYRRKQRGKNIRSGSAPLKLTSMMDILTVLLLFLLKSFVIEGEVISPAPGVELPESTSEAQPQSSVVIAIFDDAIMMDGELVATVRASTSGDDLVIEPLALRLDAAREKAVEIAKRRGEAETFTGRVAIQGDRDIPFSILQRVMFTCGAAGFEDISLAVIGI